MHPKTLMALIAETFQPCKFDGECAAQTGKIGVLKIGSGSKLHPWVLWEHSEGLHQILKVCNFPTQLLYKTNMLWGVGSQLRLFYESRSKTSAWAMRLNFFQTRTGPLYWRGLGYGAKSTTCASKICGCTHVWICFKWRQNARHWQFEFS